MTRVLALLVTLGPLALGCGASAVASSGPRKVDIPVSDGEGASRPTTLARETAPLSSTAKASPFPAVGRASLSNGLDVAVVHSAALPIVQVRLVVRAGSGYGPTPAVAALTGDMLKDGGTRAMASAEVLRRVETLGSALSVSTDFDSSVLSMAVTKDALGEALALLSQVVREPRFDADELRKRKARATDEAEEAARSSGAWTTTRLVFRELFPPKSLYATYGAVPSEIAKVDGAAIRDFHRRFYVPKASTLVFAGDVDLKAAKELAERHFGGWTGGDPPKVEPAPLRAPTRTRVLVAHRAKSVQSDVSVVMVAPARNASSWAAVRIANQILGGGVASRIFSDVREQRSLAYRTSAQILELAHGEQPLVVQAGTETGKTTEAVAALMENIARMTSSPPTGPETEGAGRYLSDVFAIRMETIGSIADLVVAETRLGLPDDYWDAYRKQLRATEPPAVGAAAKQLYTPGGALIVVAGDADVIAAELASFGDVTVVDPEKEFKTMRTLPQVTK